MKRILRVVLLTGLGMMLVACGSNAETTKKSENESGKSSSKLAKKQELHLSERAEIPSMDTALATDLVSFNAMNNVFEGLYITGQDGNPMLGMAAEEPKMSSDSTVYTFKIRADAKWSNGTPVAADDFVFNWQKTVDPATASSYAYMYEGLVKNASQIIAGELPITDLGIKALSDKELEVTLEQPTAYFLKLLALPFFGPQNRAYVTDKGADYASNSENLIYNGPFVLTDWSQATGVSWSYAKNPDYWDAKTVKLDKITVDVMKEVSTEVNLYEAGDLDRAFLSGTYLDQYKDSPDYLSIQNATTFYIGFNGIRDGQETALQNTNIRRGIAMSIDKKGYIDNVLKDGSKAIDGFVPAGLAKNPETGEDFRKEAGKLLSYNKKAAKKAWNQGLSEISSKDVTLQLVTSDTTDSKKLGEYLQNELTTNLPGLTVELNHMPFKNKLAVIQEHNYDMAVNSWIADYADPVNFLERFVGSGNNFNYKSEAVDQLLHAAAVTDTNNETARWQDLIKAEQIAVGKDAVLAPLYQSADTYLQKPTVKAINKPVFGPESYKWAYISKE